MSAKKNKKEGLEQKFHVEKISNPDEKIDAIVLEFDDPIARVGIEAWANEMRDNGFLHCAADVFEKLLKYERGDL